MNIYKKENSLEFRKSKSQLLLNKYNDRLPIIVQKSDRDKSLPDMPMIKLLTPKNISLNNLLINIKNKYINKINANIAIYLFTENNHILTGNDIITTIYDIHKDKQDNFLYLFFCSENTFG